MYVYTYVYVLNHCPAERSNLNPSCSQIFLYNLSFVILIVYDAMYPNMVQSVLAEKQPHNTMDLPLQWIIWPG